jgi:uncharacterized membrane protein YidH (DUF202 family)
MSKTDKGVSPNFKDVADQVFGTLLTITTILSGVYASIAFGWFGQAMITPHEGGPMTSEMLAAAIVGIFLGVVFILPLVFILLSWAFAKFRNSSAWATAAWSGLIYCLAQDFIGIIALFSFFLIAAGAFVGTTLIIAGAFVILIPPVFSIWIGHIIGVRYSQLDETTQKGKRHPSLPALAMVFLILVIQTSLVAFLFLAGEYMWG